MEVANCDWEQELINRHKENAYYTENELIDILKSLVNTLAELQKRGISHRDVKPQNILCFGKDGYKLSDFGEAKTKKKTFIKSNNYAYIRSKKQKTLRGTELYEIFESQRSLYLVMEECKGGEVFDRIIDHIQKKQMYSEKDAAIIFQQFMSAVEYCHNNGICHRDLKPENLLYLNEGPEEDNPIKVIDFGLSQIFHNRKLKTKVGTAYYVSPEILDGNYTEKCDIWSAGVILYILLSGDPPFNGPDDNAIYKKISTLKYTFPENKWRNVSNEAKDLITHMICPEEGRYNARQVLDHSWLRKANNKPLTDFNFDPKFLFRYKNSNYLKKMSLLFIASRLDENEIKDLNKIFSAFDQDKDGQISIKELREGILQLKSVHLNEEEIYNLFKAMDVDKNFRIDYTEFLAATISEKNYLKRERLYEAFCILDKDNDGKITKEEIMDVLKSEKSQEKVIENLIKEVDTNGDGTIDYGEFMRLMGFDGIIEN